MQQQQHQQHQRSPRYLYYFSPRLVYRGGGGGGLVFCTANPKRECFSRERERKKIGKERREREREKSRRGQPQRAAFFPYMNRSASRRTSGGGAALVLVLRADKCMFSYSPWDFQKEGGEREKGGNYTAS